MSVEDLRDERGLAIEGAAGEAAEGVDVLRALGVEIGGDHAEGGIVGLHGVGDLPGVVPDEVFVVEAVGGGGDAELLHLAGAERGASGAASGGEGGEEDRDEQRDDDDDDEKLDEREGPTGVGRGGHGGRVF